MEQCDPSHVSPMLSAGIQPRIHSLNSFPPPGWAGSSPTTFSKPDAFCSRAGRCSRLDISGEAQGWIFVERLKSGYFCPRPSFSPWRSCWLLSPTAGAGCCRSTQQRAHGWSRFQIQPPDFKGVGCRTANHLLTLQSRVLQPVLNHGRARVGSDWGHSCAEHVGRCFSRLLPQYSSWSYTEFGG